MSDIVLFEKNPKIREIYTKFALSSEFGNFKELMKDLANAKFREMQDKNLSKSYEDMKSDKVILNFYINFPNMIESITKSTQDMEKYSVKSNNEPE